MTSPNYWHDEMNEETARRVIGSRHFDWVVKRGASFCRGQAGFAWQANLQETYAAYCAAEKQADKVTA